MPREALAVVTLRGRKQRPDPLALDLLQYDALAEFLLRFVGGVVVAGVAGFFVYGTVWKGLSAWIRSVVAEPPDATPATSRVEFQPLDGLLRWSIRSKQGAVFRGSSRHF